jgi:hypothetical protein
MLFKRLLAIAIIVVAVGAGLLLIRFVEQATQSMAAPAVSETTDS